MNRGNAADRRLIDRFRFDVKGLGDVRRIVATTHNLEADFFEHDFLPNVLGVPNAEDHAFKARTELQRRLQQCDLVAVAMDAAGYQGRPSLRTTLRPVTLRGRRLHAKLLAVQYEHGVRVSVGSANLTPGGFRLNREVAGVLETRDDSEADAGSIATVLKSAVDALVVLRERGAQDVVEGFAAIAEAVRRWHPKSKPQHDLVWSGGAESLAQDMVQRWSGPGPVERIRIVSPFWAEDGTDRAPLVRFVALLRDAGKLAPQCDVELYLDAAALAEGGHAIAYPAGFALSSGLGGVKVTAHAVDPTVDQNDLDMKVELNKARALHAKVVILEGGERALAYAGSGNFTRAGWGIGVPGNIELGWVLTGSPKQLRELVPETTGQGEEIRPGQLLNDSAPAEEEEAAFWPSYLLGADLEPDPDDPDRLLLVVRADQSAPRFAVATVGDAASASVQLLEAGGSAGAEVRAALGSAALQQIMHEREVLITEVESGRSAHYPVNVAAGEARLRLPIAPGAGRPGEAALIAYFQGKVDFEDLYPPPGEAAQRLHVGPRGLEESGVDTSQILSYQVREFVQALPGIRAEITSVGRSRAALEFALLGQVGPVGLARAICEAAEHGGKSAVAAAFQLVELLRVLEDAASAAAEEDFREVYQRAITRVREYLARVKARDAEAFSPQAAFSKYESVIGGGAP
ncbi:MAG: hypothetical protein KC776_39325 [Myxococcales bacterium]|nr:hypothetical protein [Myxococcales bacterium]MCB9583643.1 hypothetical protein [Polyangiaceae bacterium]